MVKPMSYTGKRIEYFETLKIFNVLTDEKIQELNKMEKAARAQQKRNVEKRELKEEQERIERSKRIGLEVEEEFKRKEEAKSLRKQVKDYIVSDERQAMKGKARVHTITTTIGFKSLLDYKVRMKSAITKKLKELFDDLGKYKAVLNVTVGLSKLGDDKIVPFLFSSGGEYEKDGKTTHNTTPIISKEEINAKYNAMMNVANSNMEKFMKQGSNWVFRGITHIDVKAVKFETFKGSSYIPCPKWILNKKCCVNVKNEDEMCFKYTILSALHYDDVSRPELVSSYKKYWNELDFNGIDFPVSADDIEQFEVKNNIPVNVFSCDVDGEPGKYDLEYIHKISSEKEPIQVLRIYNSEKSHYVWIKRLNAFVKTSTEHLFCCGKCFQKFYLKSAYENHLAKNKCKQYHNEAVKMLPKEGETIVSFKNYHKQLPTPFVIYADCESILVPCDEKVGDSTQIYQSHKVLNIGCKLVSKYPDLLKDDYKQFDGYDCMNEFLRYIFDIQNKAIDVVKTNTPMRITPEQEQSFRASTHCNICNKELGSDRVRDHDHITGEYRGACHSKCNIDFNYKGYKLPIIFHNLRGYDSHFILQAAGNYPGKKITCIPNTMEKYLSFTLDKCVFLDSLQFVNSSLESLVVALNKVGKHTFKTFNESFPNVSDELNELLRQKGVFPYDWYDSADKQNETSLPSKDCFYSKLAEEHISEDNYQLAKKVWSLAGCKTFYDYISLYLKTDVVLLADVFEAFRNMCLENYGLDPCHYFTAPGFSWDAMLKMTDVKIDCFKEGQEDMLEMIQRGMRGGISVITHRYARANNKYIQKYNPNEESSYIMYLDANNLYGWAMSQYLPVGEYKWESVEDFNEVAILEMEDESDTGYVFEVDLDYPEEIHDKHNDYPLAPETTHFEASPYMKDLAEKMEMTECTVNKLIPNLHHKRNYVLHYRNLKLYLQLGMKLVTIHKVLSFKQTPFLKDYINFNTTKRASCTNDFEKDLFKLFNNAIFGKTCENVEKRIDVKLMTDSKKFVDTASKPYFKDFRIFSNDLVAVEMRKCAVRYNRPMIVGMCILELSKVLMYDFHYNYIKSKYDDKAKLLFTDTDSLTYHIKTEDIYDDMRNDLTLFDTSDYPKSHPCYSTSNKKVIGKFKDETNAVPIIEFVGLRSKMYSILKSETQNKAVAKGIKKCAIKRLTHNDYKRAIFGTAKTDLRQLVSFNNIRSRNHQVNTIKLTKVGLSSFDDKRYVLQGNVETLAHGHYSTTK